MPNALQSAQNLEVDQPPENSFLGEYDKVKDRIDR